MLVLMPTTRKSILAKLATGLGSRARATGLGFKHLPRGVLTTCAFGASSD